MHWWATFIPLTLSGFILGRSWRAWREVRKYDKAVAAAAEAAANLSKVKQEAFLLGYRYGIYHERKRQAEKDGL